LRGAERVEFADGEVEADSWADSWAGAEPGKNRTGAAGTREDAHGWFAAKDPTGAEVDESAATGEAAWTTGGADEDDR
jgi:hypothetical protein